MVDIWSLTTVTIYIFPLTLCISETTEPQILKENRVDNLRFEDRPSFIQIK